MNDPELLDPDPIAVRTEHGIRQMLLHLKARANLVFTCQDGMNSIQALPSVDQREKEKGGKREGRRGNEMKNCVRGEKNAE